MKKANKLKKGLSEISEQRDNRTTLAEAGQRTYGNQSFRESSGRYVITPRPLEEVRPDPTQARRAAPPEVRELLLKGEVSQAFETWFQLAADALDVPYDDVVASVDAALRLETDDPQPEAVWLDKLAAVAVSIRKAGGLTNPITASRTENGYVIETGERRWISYNLLHWWASTAMPDEAAQWEQIPMHIVTEIDVWRQAYENSAREDLNAISRAQQLARLLMVVHDEADFGTLETFDHERDYYAQVADGNSYRVPYGKGGEVAAAIGVKSGAQVRQYRRLLTLPSAVWDLADAEDIPELVLRQSMNSAENEEDLLSLLQAYVDESVTTVTDSDQREGEKPDESVTTVTDSPEPSAAEQAAKTFAARARSIAKVWSVLGDGIESGQQLEPDQRDSLLSEIDEQIAWLEGVRQQLK